MILSNEQIRRAEKEEDVDRSRKRATMKSKLWPKGEVPYVIDSSLSKYLMYQNWISQVQNIEKDQQKRYNISCSSKTHMTFQTPVMYDDVWLYQYYNRAWSKKLTF